MKRILTAILLLSAAIARAQTGGTIDISPPPPPPAVQADSVRDSAAFILVEQMPGFPGGDKAMKKFIVDSLVYPEQAKNDGIDGLVIITFVVEKDGRLTDIKVRKSAHPILDAEALRIVNKMPAWKPGKQNGRTVRVQYTLPIAFKL